MNNIVETKNCKACGVKFDIFQEDLDFYNKLSPNLAGVKYQLPVPDTCPDCRQQRRSIFRNRRNLYKRKCDLTGKNIISMYSPDKPYKVYFNKDYEEQVDATDYGRDFDFLRSFFPQMKELQLEVPRFHSAVITDTMENSDYVNGAHSTKDSYLSFSVTDCEGVYYCEGIYNSKDCIDCYHVHDCELSYECIESSKMYKSIQCTYCSSCSNCDFCYNCESCNDCFGCVNLSNKQYCIYNKQYTKEEYQKIVGEYKFTNETIKIFKTKVEDLKNQYPQKFARVVNVENSIGDDLINTKNCYHCFGCEDTEDMRYCYNLNESKDCMDVLYFGTNLQHSYRSTTGGHNTQNIYFCLECYENSSNLFYCDNCNSNVYNCFGCVGLRNKEYCIFNKQYSKEEYQQLVPKIIEHMKNTGERGLYFPRSYSTFGYNESLAQEYYPLEKSEAIKKGYNRMDSEYNIDIPKGIEMIDSKDLPKNIEDVSDDILDKAIVCNETGKPFRIIKKELEYYRKMGIGLPQIHYNQRHMDRLSQINKKKIYHRKCDKCNVDITTTYPSSSERTIYCKSCYDKDIY